MAKSKLVKANEKIAEKVRNVFRNKGMSGAPLTTNQPYGYRKGSENTKQNVQWIVDEPAAESVRQIFAWCVDGLGPTQIAKRLKAANVMTPTEHWSSTAFRKNSDFLLLIKMAACNISFKLIA